MNKMPKDLFKKKQKVFDNFRKESILKSVRTKAFQIAGAPFLFAVFQFLTYIFAERPESNFGAFCIY